MKWIVAGAGVLLSIAGLYGLVSGASIIQVERGWATFIAGSVAGAAGLIIMAIAALMAHLERLASVLSPARTDAELVRHEDVRMPAPLHSAPPVFAPQMAVPPAVSIPEVSDDAARAPIFADIKPLRIEPAPEAEAEAEPEPVPETAKEERPPALRDFKFVFPPLEDERPPEKEPEAAPESAAPVRDEDKIEPPLSAEDRPENRFNLGWLRRNRTDDSLAPRIRPEPFVDPAPAPEIDLGESEEKSEAASVEIEPDFTSGESVSHAPIIQRDEKPQTKPDPFSADWLERALAGTDDPQDVPQQRFVPPSRRRAQMDEPVVPAPAPAVSVDDADTADAPVEIGRYSANDVAYVMFSDGSISAETANGTFRFSSLIELKDFIERGA